MSRLKKRNMSNLEKFLHNISKIKVEGTSMFQLVGNEIMENLKSSFSQSNCGCKCCSNSVNTLIEVQTKINQFPEALHNNETVGPAQMEIEPENNLSQTSLTEVSTSKISSGRKKPVAQGQKSTVVKPPKSNTQKTSNSKAKSKDKPVTQSSVSTKKRKRTTDLKTPKKLPIRSCAKKISYSSKIPHISSMDELQMIKKLHFSSVQKQRARKPNKPNPDKTQHKKEKGLEQDFYYNGSKSGNQVINVKDGDKQFSIYVKGKVPQKVLKKLSRTAGVGGTISSNFLKKHSPNLQLVNPTRRTLYSANQWMSSSEFASMCFD